MSDSVCCVEARCLKFAVRIRLWDNCGNLAFDTGFVLSPFPLVVCRVAGHCREGVLEFGMRVWRFGDVVIPVVMTVFLKTLEVN